MNKIATKDKEYLNRQFQIYYKDKNLRPDFIICGGTFKRFKNLIDIFKNNEVRSTSRGMEYIQYDNNKFLISYHHPEARVKRQYIILYSFRCN